ncbi:MAG: hypothetical protein GM46_3950 [actinobacterium acAcidi]|nr:MAG: hypothetical protein GM46_3950 [actinobacterium acAcidi]
MKTMYIPRHRKIRIAFTACMSLAMLAACSTSPNNYKTKGEKFLESEDIAKSAGYRYKYALCDQPQSIQVGTQYACIATDNDDNSWEFIIEITGDREFTVVEGKVVK